MSSEFEGESATTVYRGTLLVIEGDELYFTDGFAQSNPSRFRVDATSDPKSIDLGGGDDPAGLTRGIYSLDEDSLKLCMSLEGERPKEFKTHAGDKTNLFVLKRQ